MLPLPGDRCASDRPRYQCAGPLSRSGRRGAGDAASRLIGTQCTNDDPGFVSLLVLAELVWVLDRALRLRPTSGCGRVERDPDRSGTESRATRPRPSRARRFRTWTSRFCRLPHWPCECGQRLLGHRDVRQARNEIGLAQSRSLASRPGRKPWPSAFRCQFDGAVEKSAWPIFDSFECADP